MKTPKYTWNPETGEASCIICYNDLEFVGTAYCHPEDGDMKSKLTGQTIAEIRAMLAYLRHIRDNELRPQLKSLNQLYYSMNRSKNYNKKSYESYMLYRQIRILQNDLDTIKIEIANLRKGLKEYIEQKEKDHQIIREYHLKAQLVENNQ